MRTKTNVCIYRGYENPPKPSEEELYEAGCNFAAGILSALKTVSIFPFYIHMKLNVWRYITYKKGTASQHQGHVLYSKEDFQWFKTLPNHWWYCVDKHGEGKAVDFPIKIKAVLSWSPVQHISKSGKLIKAPRYPAKVLNFSTGPSNYTPYDII